MVKTGMLVIGLEENAEKAMPLDELTQRKTSFFLAQ